MTKFIDKTKKEVKETVFTHYLNNAHGWMETLRKPKDFKEVNYIGRCRKDGDMFYCTHDGFIEIVKGTKGGEAW